MSRTLFRELFSQFWSKLWKHSGIVIRLVMPTILGLEFQGSRFNSGLLRKHCGWNNIEFNQKITLGYLVGE